MSTNYRWRNTFRRWGGGDVLRPVGESVDVEQHVAVELHHDTNHHHADQVHQETSFDLSPWGNSVVFYSWPLFRSRQCVLLILIHVLKIFM